jgi:hypothetical protein
VSCLYSISLRDAGFLHPITRMRGTLLGPCFKTGRLETSCRFSGRASILELESFPSAPGAVLIDCAGVNRRSPYSRVIQKSNTTSPGVRSAFCLPKECQPSVTGPAVGCYDSASPRAASEASATQTSAASDYPPTTSDSTISSLLTLFSKFFSPFLRSTCSLSVSHKYLALEEVYLPFRAAVPNNPTLGGLLLQPALVAYGAVTLCGVLFQGTHTRCRAFASTL